MMLLIEYREHDGGDLFRAWTQEDYNYGAFKVLTRRELQTVIRACTLMGGLCRPASDAHIDQIDMGDYGASFLPPIDAHAKKLEQLGST